MLATSVADNDVVYLHRINHYHSLSGRCPPAISCSLLPTALACAIVVVLVVLLLLLLLPVVAVMMVVPSIRPLLFSQAGRCREGGTRGSCRRWRKGKKAGELGGSFYRFTSSFATQLVVFPALPSRLCHLHGTHGCYLLPPKPITLGTSPVTSTSHRTPITTSTATNDTLLPFHTSTIKATAPVASRRQSAPSP